MGIQKKINGDFSSSNGGDTNSVDIDEIETSLICNDATNRDFTSKTENTESAMDTEEKKNNMKNEHKDDSFEIVFDIEKPKAQVYNIAENPPLIWALMFGFQQAMVSISSPLTTTLVVSETACFQEDSELKLQILSSTFLMSGLSTFCMTSFGVRLPIFQGPSSTYLFPLLALQTLDEWKCPPTFKALDSITNTTILMADLGNGTSVPNREVSLDKIAVMSGGLIAAGAVHFLVGFSGLIGIFSRYIGPVTIVPTITLVGLQLYKIAGKYCGPDWTIAVVLVATNLILSLFLAKRKTPIPMWNRQKGFYIYWYPLHQVLSILIALILGYILSTIFTNANFYSDDPKSRDYLARTDARLQIVSDSHWFRIPYPGQFGSISFSFGIFANFLVATVSSIIDSIGDYAACARICRVSPPPPFAFNRGLAVEGLMSTLGGAMGCCHGTVSYGSNMGAMSITKVTSRRVFQMTGILFVFFGIFSKFGAVFISLPYPILGGIFIATLGIFIGMLLSNLQNIDLNSNRNLAIIGLTLMVGMVVPYWVPKNPDVINTGNTELDGIIQILLSNPAFVAGLFSAFLDNTIPGTRKERGLQVQMDELGGDEMSTASKVYEFGQEAYRMPFLPDSVRKSWFAKIFPIFDRKDV